MRRAGRHRPPLPRRRRAVARLRHGARRARRARHRPGHAAPARVLGAGGVRRGGRGAGGGAPGGSRRRSSSATPRTVGTAIPTTSGRTRSRWPRSAEVPARLLYAVVGRGTLEAALADLGETPFRMPAADELPSVPDAAVTTRLDVRDQHARRVAAMRAHATQVVVAPDERSFAMSNDVAQPILDVEEYIAVDGRTGTDARSGTAMADGERRGRARAADRGRHPHRRRRPGVHPAVPRRGARPARGGALGAGAAVARAASGGDRPTLRGRAGLRLVRHGGGARAVRARRRRAPHDDVAVAAVRRRRRGRRDVGLARGTYGSDDRRSRWAAPGSGSGGARSTPTGRRGRRPGGCARPPAARPTGRRARVPRPRRRAAAPCRAPAAGRRARR